MLIEKNILEYVVLENESILHSLERINKNKSRILFVTSSSGLLLGSFSDGDFRRWVTSSGAINLSYDVSVAMNKSVISRSIDSPRSELMTGFVEGVELIPLVDKKNRVVAIAIKKEDGFVLGKKTISESSPALVIAEIGNNHQGDIALAKQLVDLAVDAGADCVKFQMRDMSKLYKRGAQKDSSADLGTQYTLDLLSKFQLKNSELFEVFDYVKLQGVEPLCTPWDIESLNCLEEYGMQGYKVASADFTNFELLEALSRTGKLLICSTGMSTESEIKSATEFLRHKGSDFIALHCNSTYPTPYKDINLAYLPRLKEITGTMVGYSGHERGYFIPLVAVGLGAKVIEKHFTIDKQLEGNDHKVSLLPEEFKEMTNNIRQLEEGIGSSDARFLSQGELINRETLAKSIVANKNIEKGEVIRKESVTVKGPGQGLQPLYLEKLLGRKSARNMEAGDLFYESDLDDEIIQARSYCFNRPFGIPVRYHDYQKLVSKSNFDFIEFHLSYNDMELEIEDFIPQSESIGFAVHSPELFSGDHILDLAAHDESYRVQSVKELNRVCEITRKLKKYFPLTERPVIVTNIGGFTTNGFITDAKQKLSMYDSVHKSLEEVKKDGVEIIIQTMPPFPWHFGGQSYHNLFLDPEEISDFCKKHGYRICFDVSHSMMACSYYGWDLGEFTKLVAPFTAHLHIVDAKGVDGEGIQMGDGDVDFSQLSKNLQKHGQDIPFIPEVWQGHKNDGEGFWRALDFLESFFI